MHSKLMIIDDRLALIGSSNINDRSLLGSRDSEVLFRLKDYFSDHIKEYIFGMSLLEFFLVDL